MLIFGCTSGKEELMNKDDISKLLNIPVDDEVKVRSIEFKDGVKYIELYKAQRHIIAQPAS